MKKLFASLMYLSLAVALFVLLPANSNATEETHNFDNGFCQSCGCYQPAVLNGDVYEISNAGQLYWFAEQAKENTAINGRLMQNIVVNEGELSASTDVFREWYPIGKYDGYSGTFDGNDMEISGLHIYGTDKFGAGLFYDISAGGIVKNVCVSNIYFVLDYKEMQDGASNVGGIAAYNHGTIESCSFEGYLEGYFYIGGIAGRNRGTINNCSATGTINSYRDYTGGIAGSNTGKITNCQNEANITGKDWYYSYQGKMYPSCYIGGIVGLNLEQGVVDAGHNHGKVGGCKDVGGIAGNNQGSVRSCSNNNDVWLYNDGLRESAMGGIVGRNEGGAITDCFNNGNINGFYNVGGIVGYHSGSDDGRIIVSCYTTGTVTGQSNVGNAVGYSVGSISNCFYLSDTETDTLDGTTAKTTEQFASGEVTWLLNGSTAAGDLVWFQTCGEGYPSFEGSTVYRNQIGGCTQSNFIYAYANISEAPIETHNGDENKCHLCDDCGDELSKCGEVWVPYGDGYIIVDHENLLALKQSTFAQCMNMDTLFRRVDLCVATAEEMSSGFFSVLFSNNDFLGFLADELGAGMEDLERKAAELMRETGISLEKLQANATVLYVARLASEMNAEDVLAFMLRNNGVDIYEFMRYGMGRDADCGEAVTYASLVYGMYNAYVADFGGNEDLVERPVSAVQEIRYDANFRNYLRTDEAKRDLEGFLGILRIANNRTESEKLICEGFHNEDLVRIIEAQLTNFNHECAVCGRKLSDCVPVIEAAKEPTCTENGLSEGKRCLVCESILAEVEEIPSLGHSFAEYIPDGKGLKIACCERNCGATDAKVDENYQSGDIEIAPEEDEDDDRDSVTIDADLLKEILNAHKNFALHFVGELLDLLFDCDALDAIKDMMEDAPNVSIIVQNRTDQTEGDKPDKLRFDLSLKIGDRVLENSDFGAGSVTVTVPLDELQMAENQYIKVYYIEGDKRTEMKSERHGKKVSFKTNHFSEYEIVVETCAEHNYENGVCRICGAEKIMDLFALAGTNLRLGEDLTIFFYVNKSDLSGTDYYAQIRRTYSDGTPDEIITIPYSAWEIYNDSLMRFGYEGLPAAAMADELYITIYKTDGTAVSSEKEDSIQMYAMRQIGGANTSAKVNTLLVDMLNYGAAAQEFFKYNTAELANADLTEMQQNLYATKTADAVDRREKGTNYVGSTLILANRIEFTFYFTNLSRDMYAEVEYIDIYNKTQKMTIPGSQFITNSGYLGVNIDGLPAGDGKQLISCTVYDHNGNHVADAKDSVEGYIARMSQQDKLYTMVMRFVVSSKAYFGK